MSSRKKENAKYIRKRAAYEVGSNTAKFMLSPALPAALTAIAIATTFTLVDNHYDAQKDIRDSFNKDGQRAATEYFDEQLEIIDNIDLRGPKDISVEDYIYENGLDSINQEQVDAISAENASNRQRFRDNLAEAADISRNLYTRIVASGSIDNATFKKYAQRYNDTTATSEFLPSKASDFHDVCRVATVVVRTDDTPLTFSEAQDITRCMERKQGDYVRNGGHQELEDKWGSSVLVGLVGGMIFGFGWLILRDEKGYELRRYIQNGKPQKPKRPAKPKAN